MQPDPGSDPTLTEGVGMSVATPRGFSPELKAGHETGMPGPLHSHRVPGGLRRHFKEYIRTYHQVLDVLPGMLPNGAAPSAGRARGEKLLRAAGERNVLLRTGPARNLL